MPLANPQLISENVLTLGKHGIRKQWNNCSFKRELGEPTEPTEPPEPKEPGEPKELGKPW